VRKIPTAIYQTPAEIEARVRKLEAATIRIRADSDKHRQVMREISQLRVDANAKRWLAPPSASPRLISFQQSATPFERRPPRIAYMPKASTGSRHRAGSY
jgi:hypothetical protein